MYVRETKSKFVISDYQKVIRDFAFVIDEKYSLGEIVGLVKKINKELIKEVKIFDIFQICFLMQNEIRHLP